MADRLNGKTQCILGEMWQEAYERGGSLSFKVVTGSMSPMIKVGDVVSVTKAEPSRICIGDIVAFKVGQHVVVHRVIGKSLSNQQIIFRQMGDAGAPSGQVAAQNLIGRVSVVKKDGHEIFLDKSWYVMSNRILGWRLRFMDGLRRTQHRKMGMGLRFVLRPVWRLCRSLLLWRL